MSLISISGFIALITYIATLLPSNLTSVFPLTRKFKAIKLLAKYRREVGLISFFFASIHSAITISHLNIDFLALETYTSYYSGIGTLIIFTLLAITSNRFSIRRLKRAWKILHKFTYVAMFLLLIHIWNLMLGQWTILTGIGFNLLCSVTIFYLIRTYLNFRKKSLLKLTS